MINSLNNDEKIILNSISQGFDIPSLSRSRVLDSLSFSYQISTGASVMDTLHELMIKLKNTSDGEWEELKKILPFETDYDLPYSP